MLEPDGLLASGGELSPEWLLSAYQQGIFPWFNTGEPILWWSPAQRFGFVPGQVHLSKSRIRQLRKTGWTVRADSCFDKIIGRCAEIPRNQQTGTWITDSMRQAYSRMHELGYGHSIEVFDKDILVGGLYGLAIGQMFFAESMFSASSHASALALFALSQTLQSWHWPWLDAQMENPHLQLLGGQAMLRPHFLSLLAEQISKTPVSGSWLRHFPDLSLHDYLRNG